MRICSTCKIQKPFSEFHKKGNGYCYKCKECQSLYVKQHYQLNKKKYKDFVLSYKERNKNYIRSIKESTPCFDCGISYPYYVMDFDHLKDKEFCISKFSSKSIETLQKEIAKCQIVCSNCHRERTFGYLRCDSNAQPTL